MSFDHSVPVNLIRQWCYCPRKVYYFELTNFKVYSPLWVKQGERYHDHESHLWKRRDLSRFKLEGGEKLYNYALRSQNHDIHGLCDLVIKTKEAVFVSDFKLTTQRKRLGNILQLAAYGIMASEQFNLPCHTGFLTGPNKQLDTINFTDDIKTKVIDAIAQIHSILNCGIKPDSSASDAQCQSCEYVNHCNDR